MTWTRFMDMHSGGGLKEKWAYILIEAPEAEAKVIFYNRFGHNPERVTCTCCGEDYSIHDDESLAKLTAYDRGCVYLAPMKDKQGRYVECKDPWYIEHNYLENPEEMAEALRRGYSVDSPDYLPPLAERFAKVQTLAQYRLRKDVLIIPAKDIKPEERKGTVPQQGYVWQE